MTVTPTTASSSTESSVSRARSSRTHVNAQPEQAHSFAHALKEGLNKSKEEDKDTSKPKKPSQDATGKDAVTPSSDDTENTNGTKPITGKFGLAVMPADAKPGDAKTTNPEAVNETTLDKNPKSSGNADGSAADITSASALGDKAQAAALPPSLVSGSPVIKDGKSILIAMLAQSRLNDLNFGHGTGNSMLLAGVDLANSPILAPSLATLAAVQNAPSSPASSVAGAEQPARPSSNQSLPDATASSGETTAAAAPLPGHLAFALRLSAGTLNSQIHTDSPPDALSSAQPVSAVSISSAAPAIAVPPASLDKREEQGSDAPPQHERSAPEGIVQPSAAQASQNDTAVSTSATEVRAPVPELDDKLDDASTEPIRNVNMQVIGEGNRRVNIALVDRSGELRVSVHSADTGLNQKLQDKMPELTSQLEGQKYDAEVWMPCRDSSDRQNQDDSKQQDRPKWVEELQQNSGNSGRNQSTWLQ